MCDTAAVETTAASLLPFTAHHLPRLLPLRSAISPSFCSSHASFIFPLLSAYFFSPSTAAPPPRRLSLYLSLPVAVRGGTMTICSRPATPPPPSRRTPPTSSSTPTSGEGLRHNGIAHTYVHMCARARRPCHVEKMCSRARGGEGRGTLRGSRGRDKAAGLPARSDGAGHIASPGRLSPFGTYIILPGRANNVELFRQGPALMRAPLTPRVSLAQPALHLSKKMSYNSFPPLQ